MNVWKTVNVECSPKCGTNAWMQNEYYDFKTQLSHANVDAAYAYVGRMCTFVYFISVKA